MSQLQQFNSYITNSKVTQYLSEVLGARKEQFVTNLVSIVSSNNKLQKCTPSSLMYACLKATSLGLPVDQNLGFAWIIPYKRKFKDDKGKWDEVLEAQYQTGWKGFVQLAMRTGQFKTINVTDVRQSEIRRVDRLTGDFDIEWLEDDERIDKPVVGYMAYFKLLNGFEKTSYMSIQKLTDHAAKYSKSYSRNDSNWKTDFDSMASKTVLKLLLSKYAPLSIDNAYEKLSDAIASDQAVITDKGYDYVDNDKVDESKVDKAASMFEDAKVEKTAKPVTNTIFASWEIKYREGYTDVFDDMEKEGYKFNEKQLNKIQEIIDKVAA